MGRISRKAITKKVRFEVFKRDSFTCQYCGKGAPDAVLNVDHINPVAKGGDNHILNLVTSCFDCNSGKSDRALGDGAVVRKQTEQLKILNQRREQIQMIALWRQELINHEEEQINIFVKHIETNYGFSLTDFGRSEFRKIIDKYGLEMVLEAAGRSAKQYLIDASVKEHRAKFLDYIPRICYWIKRERENPVEAELRKMAYTANRRWNRCDPVDLSHKLISLNRHHNIDKDDLYLFIKGSTGIMQFQEKVNTFLGKPVMNGY